MKKIKYLVILFITVLLCACSNSKEAISSETFKKVMKDNKYEIIDVKEQFADYDYIKEAYVARDKTNSYQLEFYVLQTPEHAIDFYNYNKGLFESSKPSTSAYTNVDLKNHSKYTLSTSDNYSILSRIDNTVIYINVESKYKKDINNILKKLGY